MKTFLRVAFVAALSISSLAGLDPKVDAAGVDQLNVVTPTPTQTPRPRVIDNTVPAATPIVTPTPSVIVTPAPTPVSRTQTIEELQTNIRQRLFAMNVRRGRIGIKIVSLNSGKVVFENDSDKYFMPASNMKNFTVSTALERLGPDFKFRTDVIASSPLDTNGMVKGSLTIKGGGDVSISNAFDPRFPGIVDPYWGIDKLVDKIVAAGVKRVEGDLIGDETRFSGFSIPDSWEWDDLQTYSGAEVSALPFNDNVIDIRIRPSNSPNGSPCEISLSPANSLVQIVNRCSTVTDGGQNIRVTKSINQNMVDITGTMQAGSKEIVQSITFSHVAQLFVNVLKERLEARGIVISGKVRTVDNSYENSRPPSGRSLGSMALSNGVQSGPVTLTSLESPPFSVIAAKTMKPSQNMFTETILWTLGEQIGRTAGGSGTSAALGLAVVKGFMKQIGVPDDGIIQYDGSGLSRHDLITPSSVVTLYTYMAKQSKYAQVWRDSLTIGGVDGTLRNRFKGTAAAGNIRGKTGTIDQVSALSGYMSTAGGEPLVVSFVVNGVAVTSQRTGLIDDIVVMLANFNGKIDQ